MENKNLFLKCKGGNCLCFIMFKLQATCTLKARGKIPSPQKKGNKMKNKLSTNNNKAIGKTNVSTHTSNKVIKITREMTSNMGDDK